MSENCWNQEKITNDVVQASSDGNDFEAQTELYNHLMDLLIACRKGKQETATKISVLLPVECVNAINLTESSRLDHSGSGSKAHCDTRDMINSGRPWFRFVGQAGN